MIEPDAASRKRVTRAIAELVDEGISEPMPAGRLYELLERAMNRYLGPSTGMGVTERWYTLGVLEMSILVEALEERSAIVCEGPYKPKKERR